MPGKVGAGATGDRPVSVETVGVELGAGASPKFYRVSWRLPVSIQGKSSTNTPFTAAQGEQARSGQMGF